MSSRLEAIVFSEIRGLAEEMQPLIFQLKTPIKEDRFALLVGDDSSGRIPTLVIRSIINELHRRDENRSIPTFFLQGVPGLEFRTPKNNKMVENFKKAIELQKETLGNKKALIITEKMESGKRMSSIVRELRIIGVPYDIAAVRVSMDEGFYRATGILSEGSILYGQRGGGMPAIARSALSGIQRFNSAAIRTKGATELVTVARQDIKHAVNFLLEKH